MDLGLDAADHANGIAEVGLGMARRMRPTIGGHRAVRPRLMMARPHRNKRTVAKLERHASPKSPQPNGVAPQ